MPKAAEKERLRDSKGRLRVVPIDDADLRRLVEAEDRAAVLRELIERAILQYLWRRRVGIEPDRRTLTRTPNGFEDRANHQIRCASVTERQYTILVGKSLGE